MAQTIKLKRSANTNLSSGQGIPTTSQLDLGEVAINTYHGKMYIKKDDGTESIVEIGGTSSGALPLTGGTLTGGLTGTTGTFSGNVSGDRFILPSTASAANQWIYTNNSNTGTGSLTIQSGAGSSGYGGGLVLYSHSHASKAGWVTAGISVGSGGKFSVNSQGIGGGTDVFTVDASGNTVANGSVTADSLTVGNSSIGSNSSHLANLTINNNAHIGSSYNTSAIQIATSGATTFSHAITAAGLTVNPTTPAEISGSVSGNYILKLDNTHATSGNGLRIETPSTSANEYSLVVKSNNGSNNNLVVANNGDISFYEDTGTTAKLFWDASTERLGINTSSPAYGLDVRSTIYTSVAASTKNLVLGDSTNGKISAISTNNDALIFYPDGSNARLEINSSGIDVTGSVTADSLTVSTTYPKLQLNDETGVDRNFSVGTNNETFTIRNETASSDSLTIYQDNNVNIPNGSLMVGATTAPSAKIHGLLSSSATNTPTDVLRLGHTSTGNSAVGFGSLIRFDAQRTGSTTDGIGRLGFVTDVHTSSRVDGAFIVQTGIDGSYTERLRIGSSGNVNVSSGNLQIGGTNVINSGLAMYNLESFKMADAKKAYFGSSNDLEIYHDGSHSYIKDVGTGHLKVQGNNMYLQTADGSANYLVAINGDETKIYFDNSTKLATTSTGIDVTGTVTADGLTFGSNHRIQGTGGLFIGGSSATVFEVGAGTEKMRLTSTGLGIGTSSPASKLHISGNSDVSDEDCMLIIDDVDGSAGSRIPAIMFRSNTGGTVTNQGRIRGTDTQGMVISGSSALGSDLVVQSGKVGIKNSSPDWGIETGNFRGTASAPSFSGTGGDGFAFDFYNTGNPYPRHGSIAVMGDSTSTADISFWTDSGSSVLERMRISADGKVGIGTTSPTFDLQVVGDISLSGNYYVGNTTVIDSNRRILAGDGASNVPYITFAADTNTGFYRPASDTLGFSTAGSERMRIDSSGRVGIGMTPAEVLDLKASSGDTRVRLDAVSGSDTEIKFFNAGVAQYTIGHDDGTDNFVIGGANVDTPMVSVNKSGKVGIGTTTPASKLSVNHAGIDTYAVTTTATSLAQIDTFAAATFRSARYTVQATNSTDSTYHITEVLLIHDGTTTYITEYGTIFTGDSEGTISADIASGNVRLLVTPASTDTIAWKVVRHSILV